MSNKTSALAGVCILTVLALAIIVKNWRDGRHDFDTAMIHRLKAENEQSAALIAGQQNEIIELRNKNLEYERGVRFDSEIRKRDAHIRKLLKKLDQAAGYTNDEAEMVFTNQPAMVHPVIRIN